MSPRMQITKDLQLLFMMRICPFTDVSYMQFGRGWDASEMRRSYGVIRLIRLHSSIVISTFTTPVFQIWFL